MWRSGESGPRARLHAGILALGVFASPPEPRPLEASPAATEPAVPPPAPPRWVVSARVIPASEAALAQLRGDAPSPLGDARVDGVALVSFDALAPALAWVAEAAFASRLPFDPPALHEGPAPVPGGGGRPPDAPRVHALTISSVITDAQGTEDVSTPIWPTEEAPSDPLAGAGFTVAALMVDAAPLFAAPSPILPPAAERHAIVSRTDDLWVLGHVDRCDTVRGTRRCLHWAQVVARDHATFVFGYLPAVWVAAHASWQPDAQARPRAQLVRSGRAGALAQWVLLARDAGGTLHRHLVTAPAPGDAWPTVELRVQGARATIEASSQASIELPLDASLDARPDDL